jgi:hypothetical protein
MSVIHESGDRPLLRRIAAAYEHVDPVPARTTAAARRAGVLAGRARGWRTLALVADGCAGPMADGLRARHDDAARGHAGRLGFADQDARVDLEIRVDGEVCGDRETCRQRETCGHRQFSGHRGSCGSGEVCGHWQSCGGREICSGREVRVDREICSDQEICSGREFCSDRETCFHQESCSSREFRSDRDVRSDREICGPREVRGRRAVCCGRPAVVRLVGVVSAAGRPPALLVRWPAGPELAETAALVDEVGRFSVRGLPAGPLGLVLRRTGEPDAVSPWFVG